MPGYQDTDTSKKAAEEMLSSAATLRNQCLLELRKGRGTADQIAKRLGKSILSIRPRFSELKTKGLIRDSNKRRLNESGKQAIVWEILGND